MPQHASNRWRHGKRKAFEMERGDWWIRTNGGGRRGVVRARTAPRRARTCHRRAASDARPRRSLRGRVCECCAVCHDARWYGRQGVRGAARRRSRRGLCHGGRSQQHGDGVRGHGRCGRAAVRRGEPAGRRVRQRPPAAQRRATAHRRARAARHQAVRHQPAAASVPRLRVQDPGALPRDRLHPARRHRRLQTASYHAQGGVVHQAAEGEGPGHLRVGDPRPAAGGRRVRQVQRAVRQLHQPHPAQQAGRRVPRAAALPRAPAALLAAAPALRLLRVPAGPPAPAAGARAARAAPRARAHARALTARARAGDCV